MSASFTMSVPSGTDDFTKKLIKKLTSTLAEINGSIKDIKDDMSSLKDDLPLKVKEAQDTANENKDAIGKIQSQMQQVLTTCEGLIDENLRLKKQCNYMDNYGRRNNLVIKGVKEENNETSDICLDLAKSFMKNNLKMGAHYVDPLDIVRCHRIGGRPTGSFHRPIIVRFQRFQDRQTVWAERHNLAKSGFSLHENFSNETEYNRRKLYPILAAAKKKEQYKSKSFLNIDKLRILDKEYSVDTIDQLPTDIHPRNLAVRSDRDNKFIVFGGIHSDHYFLSNFYKLQQPMVVDGIKFPTLENAYQHEKALYFLDNKQANKIRNTSEPSVAKQCGRNVANFNAKDWEKQQKQVMTRLLRLKFQANSELAKKLLETDNKVLAEAGVSKAFSIGLPLFHNEIFKKKSWTGENLLGKCLQTIRTELKDE